MAFVLQFVFRIGLVRSLVVLVVLLVGMTGVPMVHAQFDTAAVNGAVTDPGGAVIPQATVELRNLDLGTTLVRKTNSKGEYEFPDVQIGNYVVAVSAPGFAESVTKPFDLVVAARQRVDVPLVIGEASASVTVTMDNAALQTETGEQSTTIESKEILDLPLNGREYSDLALLTPGVQVGTLQDGSVLQRRSSIVVNGNRSSVNNFLLDGLDNNSYQEANQGFSNQSVPVQTDAVQEFNVATSNFSAQYGRSGGAIVNVKTKSGSEQLHGSLFEFARNTALNAYGPFYGIGQKPGINQNQFGGSVGWHAPKVRDLFFFLDYEGFRQDTMLLESATLPSMDQRNGIFAAPQSTTVPALIGVPLQNPLTGKIYTTGIIPSTDVTPFAAAVLAALPQPTLPGPPGTDNNYQTLQPGDSYRDVGDIRLDKYIGNRLQMFARFSKQASHILANTNISGPAGGGGYGHIRVLTSAGAAGATYVLSPSSALDVRVGVIFQESGKVPYNEGLPNFYQPFGISYPISSALKQSGLNTQTIYDFSGLGLENSNNEIDDPHTFNGKVNYTLSKGRHSLSMGYEFLRVNEIEETGFPVMGEDTYTGQFSYVSASVLPKGVLVPYTTVAQRQAVGLADFMFGARDTYEIGQYNIDTEYFDYNYAYIEDSWKAASRLTLNFGLRYEFVTPERAIGKPIVNFDPKTNSLEIATSGSIYNEALVDPKLDDFAPRFGFAYSLHPNIVLRGGYGISYIQFNRFGSDGDLLSNPPTTVSTQIRQTPPTSTKTPEGLCDAGSQSLDSCFRPTMQGYPASTLSPSNYSTATTPIHYVPRSSAPGYVQSYSLGTQVQINNATILNLAYVGAHDVHLRVLADYNEAAPQLPGQTVPLDPTGVIQTRRPLQNYTDIHESTSAGYLRTNSLQAQITHRGAHGLFLMNSLTWSHAFDNASAPLEASHGDTDELSLRNLHYDDGTSGYDQRLNDSLAVAWKIPGPGMRFRPLRQLGSGWTLTSITRATTGIPMNIYYGPDTNDLTSNFDTYRPNFTGHLYTLLKPRSQWVLTGQTYTTASGGPAVCTGYCNIFNSSQLSVPTTAAAGGTTPYGNLPRNAISGPDYVNVDLGVQKSFTLPDRLKLQFRVEGFNVLNHTNFKVPGTEFLSSSFGNYGPGSTFPSRQMQFAARLDF